MDLKSLISKATKQPLDTAPAPPISAPLMKALDTLLKNGPELPTEPQESTLEQEFIEAGLAPDCQCGHPAEAHENGSDDCEILECDCISYFQLEHIVDVNEPPAPDSVRALKNTIPQCPNCGERPCQTEDRCAIDIKEAHDRKKGILPIPDHAESVTIDNKAKKYTVSKDASIVCGSDLENCGHLCDCGNWWSHGPRGKCRYPDIVAQGKCPECLDPGEEPLDPTADFEQDKLTPKGILKAKDEARKNCADMSVEQLTSHILYLSKQIEVLRAKAMEARKMRSDLEEDLASDIPEHERQKFIDQLRTGEKKVTRGRKKKESTDSGEQGVKLSVYERKLQGLMKTLGKSRTEVEAWLND